MKISSKALCALLDELAADVLTISYTGRMLHIGLAEDASHPPDAEHCHGYEIESGGHDLHTGVYIPTSGYPTEWWVWQREVSGVSVRIATAPVRCGPLERWRGGM